MTTTNAPVHEPITGEHDELGMSVLRSLGRVFADRFSMGWIRALVTGFITLGIWPFFGMSRRFRDYVSFERQQMVHLADWLRRHHDSRETEKLQDLSRRLRFHEGLHLLAILCIMIVIAVLVLGTIPMSFDKLMGATYKANPWHTRGVWPAIFVAWNVGLCIAYLLHWMQVSIYMAEFKRFIDQFNIIASKLQLKQVLNPAPRGTLSWALACILLVWFAGLWGIPLAVAGMTQRGYVNVAAVRTRKELAERMRLLLLQRRQPTNAPEPSAGPDYRVHTAKCSRELCQAPIPVDAVYCPRCGAPAGPVVHSS